jgi:hypothetical protein
MFFGVVSEITVESTMGDFALALAFLDTIWEVIRFAAEIARIWFWLRRNEARMEMARLIGFDARIWWAWLGQGLVQRRRSEWDWDSVFIWIPRFTCGYKILTCFYVVS